MKLCNHKNLFKKSISLFMILLMIISITVVTPITALADSGGEVEGNVFFDKNKNGKWERNKNEKGNPYEYTVEDVEVNLYDKNGKFIFTTKTDENGYYFFDELKNGSYIVQIVPPLDSTITKRPTGNNVNDRYSEVNEEGMSDIIQVSQENVISVDAGLIEGHYNDNDQGESSEELITLNRNIKGNPTNIEVGKEFEVEYTITPEPIPVSEVTNANNNKEIILVVDTSGSMDQKINSRKKIDIIKGIAKAFIDNLNDDEKVSIGLVQYNSIAKIESDLSENNNIEQKINHLYAEGATNTGDALRQAYYMLNKESEGNNQTDKYIVLMTDGEVDTYSKINKNNDDFKLNEGKAKYYKSSKWRQSSDGSWSIIPEKDYREKAEEYAKKIAEEKIAESDIKTFVIGFGEGINTSNQEIANRAKGSYFNALNEQQIEAIYNKIANVVRANVSGEVSFKENIPSTEFIEVVTKADGVHLEGNNSKWLVVKGNEISGNFKNVYYTLNKAKTDYVAEPIVFSVKFKGKKTCVLHENDSFVEYTVSKKDENKSDKKYFNELKINIKQFSTVIVNYGMYINNKFVSTNKVVTGYDAHLATEFKVFGDDPDIRLILDKEIDKVGLKLYKVNSFGKLTPVSGHIAVYKGEGIKDLNSDNGKFDLKEIYEDAKVERELKIKVPQSIYGYNFYLLQYTISQKATVGDNLEYHVEVNGVGGEGEGYLRVVPLPMLD